MKKSNNSNKQNTEENDKARIYSLSFYLFAFIALAVVVILLLLIPPLLEPDIQLVVKQIGYSIVAAIVVAMLIEVATRKSSANYIVSVVENLLEHKVPGILARIFLFDNEIQKYLTGDSVNKALVTCLKTQLGDEDMANELIQSPLNQIIYTKTRWNTLDARVVLRETDSAPHEYSVYENTYQISYKTVLRRPVFAGFITKDDEMFEKRLKSQEYDYYFNSWSAFFENKKLFLMKFLAIGEIVLTDCCINQKLTYRHSDGTIKESDSELNDSDQELICYDFEYGSDLLQEYVTSNKEILISYTTSSFIMKDGNYYQHVIPFPCKNVSISIDASNTDINRITPNLFFVSNSKEQLIPGNCDKSLMVKLDDWVLPMSGACFVWSRKENSSDENGGKEDNSDENGSGVASLPEKRN